MFFNKCHPARDATAPRVFCVGTCVGKLSDVLHHVEGGPAVLRVARHILQALQQHVVAHHQVRQVLATYQKWYSLEKVWIMQQQRGGK
jgi:hypothetical protein